MNNYPMKLDARLLSKLAKSDTIIHEDGAMITHVLNDEFLHKEQILRLEKSGSGAHCIRTHTYDLKGRLLYTH